MTKEQAEEPPTAASRWSRPINKKIDDMNKLPDKVTITRPRTQDSTPSEVEAGPGAAGSGDLQGMMIEWVAVKGWEEELNRTKSDGHPDHLGESGYQVFQRITENANAAMLLQSPSTRSWRCRAS